MLGQLAAALWELTAVAFLVLVVLTVRKARARGKRLFADEPMKRVEKLKYDTTGDHYLDGT